MKVSHQSFAQNIGDTSVKQIFKHDGLKRRISFLLK